MTGARREYLTALLVGAAGAAVVLVSVRQGWARVVTAEPRPLPASSVPVRGQDVLPAAGALGLAALAGLAAVLATRRVARRLVGGLLAVFGAAIIAVVATPLTTAQLRAAAAGPASAGPGSATTGSTGAGGAVAGISLSSHVALAAVPWRWAVLAGGLAVLAAGLLTAWRGAAWPVMSSRYDQPAGRLPPRTVRGPEPGPRQPPGGGPSGGPARGRPSRSGPAGDPAAMWESLSQGIDPTDPEPPVPPAQPEAAAPRTTRRQHG